MARCSRSARWVSRWPALGQSADFIKADVALLAMFVKDASKSPPTGAARAEAAFFWRSR